MAFPVTPTGFFGSGQSITYKIEESLRFFYNNNDFFYRLPLREGNRKKFTISFWFKRSAQSQATYLLVTTPGVVNDAGYIYLGSDDQLRYWDFRLNTNSEILRTTLRLRDPNAWYHIILSVDYDNAIANDRCVFYINGIRASLEVNIQPALSASEFSYFNSVTPHYIHTPSGAAQRGDFYMTEIHFIDGQQLGPTSFGFFDKNTGMWMPTRYAGTYGNNGYYLNFSNTESVSSLGYDFSRTTTPNNTPDPFWNSTMLLINSNGVLSGKNNDIIDTSGNVSIVPTVSVIQGTYSPFDIPTNTSYTSAYGGSIYLFEGDYLQLRTTPALNLGSGDWTIEFFVQYDGNKNFISLFNVDYDKFNIYRQDNGTGSGSQYFVSVRDIFAPAGNRNLTTTASASNVRGRWEHIAVVKNGNNGRLYVNGINRTVGTDADFSGINIDVSNNNYTPWIGRRSTDDGTLTDYFMRGYISNFRIVSGVAVYTDNFTPPTAPLNIVTGTSTLLNFTSANIIDSSAQNNLFLNGNVRVNTSVQRFGTGCIELTGAPNEHIYVPPSPSLGFDTHDFTIEGWIRLNTSPSNTAIVGTYNYNTAGFNGNWIFRVTSSTSLGFYSYDGTGSIQGNDFTVPTINTNTWYHVAAVRRNGTFNVYLNGTKSSTGDSTLTKSLLDGRVSGLRIGRVNLNSPFNGYIDELRISNFARYASNFSIPVSAFPDRGNKVYWNTQDTGGFVVNPTNFGGNVDIMTDTPTSYVDGGNGRGNYCTWNINSTQAAGTTSVTNGALDTIDTNASYWRGVIGTLGVSTGKWYWEITTTDNGGYDPPYILPGFVRSTYQPTDSNATNDWYPGNSSGPGIGYYFRNGNIYDNGSNYAYGNTMTTGDTAGFALDLDRKLFFVSKNGVWQNSGDPVAGTNPAPRATAFLTANNNETFLPAAGIFLSNRSYLNTGQRPFKNTPPTGYKAINTANVATSIKKPIVFFDTETYVGNGNSVTVAMTGLSSIPFSAQGNCSPDLIVIKNQSTFTAPGSAPTIVIDTVRGLNRSLSANSAIAEEIETGGVISVNGNGITVGSNSNYNTPLSSYWAWGWKKNTTAGFNILSYTGNGVSQSLDHGLGQIPNMIVVKCTNAPRLTADWWVWHKNATLPNSNWWRNYGRWNKVDAFADWGSNQGLTSEPTASTIFLGNSATVNQSGFNYIAYTWREVPGFSKFGVWTGNNSTNGPQIYCGFKPKWIMYKRIDGASIHGWIVIDTSIDFNRYNNSILSWTLINSQVFGLARPPLGVALDIFSNGFKIKYAGEDGNGSGSRYVFAAFAENPFKYARGAQ